MFYRILHFLFSMVYFSFFRLVVIGRENIPAEGAAIIASNHVSLLDPPTLGVACRQRRMYFMAKQELFANPLFSYCIRQLGAFPIRRGMADHVAVRNALAILMRGDILGIFPEGTRSKDGNLGTAGPGVMILAGKSNAPVVPAAVIGTEKISWRHPFPQITVVFGRPLLFTEAAHGRDDLQRRTDEAMSSIRQLLADHRKK